MVKQKLEDRIKYLMRRENLSSQGLAVKVDKHVTTIDRIKHGVTVPPDATLRKLANALNTPFEYLKDGEGSEHLQPKEEAKAANGTIDLPWKDEAFKMAKDHIQQVAKERDNLKDEVKNLWSMIDDFRNGRLSFLQRVGKTG